ncbi:MAG: hypothetical protein AAF310_03505 [Myxococcota bacterium]
MRLLMVTGCMMLLQACSANENPSDLSQPSDLFAENGAEELGTTEQLNVKLDDGTQGSSQSLQQETEGHENSEGDEHHHEGDHSQDDEPDIYINNNIYINFYHDDDSTGDGDDVTDSSKPKKVRPVCACKAFDATRLVDSGPQMLAPFMRDLELEDVRLIQRKRMALLLGTLVDKHDSSKRFYLRAKMAKLMSNTEEHQKYNKLTGNMIGMGAYRGVVIGLKNHADAIVKLTLQHHRKAVLKTRISYKIKRNPQALALMSGSGDTMGHGNMHLKLANEMRCGWRKVTKAQADPLVANHSGGHAMWMPGVSTKLLFNKSGRLVQFADGTARLFGRLQDKDNKNTAFHVDVKLADFVAAWQPDPAGSPKLELKNSAYAPNGPVMAETWRYYTQLDGKMIGLRHMVGGLIQLERKGPAFQMGRGANGKNKRLGASTWVKPTVLQDPMRQGMALTPNGHADFNLDITRRLGKKCQLNHELEGPVMSGNHVFNASFEEPVLTKNWDLFSSAQVPGWTVTWNHDGACNGAEALLEIQKSGLILDAAHGVQLTELDTDCRGSGIG